MHGMIFAELKKFVVAALGGEAWNQLLAAAGKGAMVYLPSQAYPDQELVDLVVTASRVTGKPAAELIEAFGEFIVPDLVRGFGAHIHPGWRTLDLLENTEGTIHRVVRASNPGATPPRLSVRRIGPREVVIEYVSERRLCALARGIVKGVAKHYTETVAVNESACMNRGDARCEMHVVAQ